MSDTFSSQSSIMSVAEVIDSAFGLPHENVVNHKLIQAVLFIMARQLKVLERQVEVIGPPISPSASTLSITEVRLHAKKKALVSTISGVGVAGIKGVRPTGPPGGKLRRGVRGKAKSEIEKGVETTIEEEEEEWEEIEETHVKRRSKEDRGEEKKKFAKEEVTESRDSVKQQVVIIERGRKQIEISEDEDEKQRRRVEKLKKGKKTRDDGSPSSETSSQKSFLTESSTKIRHEKTHRTDELESDKTSTDKLSSTKIRHEKTHRTDELESDKTSTDKLSSDKTRSQKSAKVISSLDKTAKKLKHSLDKSYSEEQSLDKTTSDKSTSDKIDFQQKPSQGRPKDKVTSKPKSYKTSTDKSAIDKKSRKETPSIELTSSSTSESSLLETSEADETFTGEKTAFKTTSTEKTTSKHSIYTDKPLLQPTSSTDKASVDRTSSTDKASVHRSSSADKTALQPTSSAEETLVKQISSVEKASVSSTRETGTEKPSLDVTASDRGLLTEKTLSADKISGKPIASSDKTSIAKTLSDKSIEQGPRSIEKGTSQRTVTDKDSVKLSDVSLKETSSVEKRIMPLTSPSDKFTADHASSAKTSTLPTKSSDALRDKIATETRPGKVSSPEKSTSKPDSDKTVAGKGEKSKHTKKPTDTSTGKKERFNRQLLEALEEKREAILRIIHQRADSREERDKLPTPMTSLDSISEAQYEKLLVVERVSSKEAREREKAARKGRTETPKLSIVTQEEFDALAQTVRRIQEKYNKIGKLELPENLELMHELRKGASLTDAMGALQLSARLEAAEKTLQNMMKIVTELALQTPGVELTADYDMEVIYGAQGAKTKGSQSHKASVSAGTATPTSRMSGRSKKTAGDTTSSEESMEIVLNKPMSLDKISGITTTPAEVPTKEKEKDRVAFFELDDALQKVHDKIMDTVNENKTKSIACADKIQKQVKRLEVKLNSSLELGDKMDVLENLVAQYAEKINALDTGLSSQMTSYQEELTQMQHDLETGLDTMAEVLANAGTDTTAVTELNTHFSNLQADIENTMDLQKDLQERQEVFAYDLSNLRAQIETLRDNKSDRDEVTDALRDKAGLGELNGLVSTEQFDAVRGDFEKRVLLAYDKFNNQEAYWQKIIEDLIKNLNDKADITQVQSLEDEIARNMGNLTAKLNAMMEIVGEPRASALTRKLHRDEACLSCATPAHLESKAPKVPALPGLRPPAIGAEAPKPGEHGDHEPCYPGRPIPHPIDPRAHICKRWCGGSHTAVPVELTKAPIGITISTIVRDTTTTVGTDGKVYQTDEPLRKPCKPCHIHTPPEPEPEQAQEAENTELKVPSTTMDECTCFPACGLWYR